MRHWRSLLLLACVIVHYPIPGSADSPLPPLPALGPSVDAQGVAILPYDVQFYYTIQRPLHQLKLTKLGLSGAEASSAIEEGDRVIGEQPKEDLATLRSRLSIEEREARVEMFRNFVLNSQDLNAQTRRLPAVYAIFAPAIVIDEQQLIPAIREEIELLGGKLEEEKHEDDSIIPPTNTDGAKTKDVNPLFSSNSSAANTGSGAAGTVTPKDHNLLSTINGIRGYEFGVSDHMVYWHETSGALLQSVAVDAALNGALYMLPKLFYVNPMVMAVLQLGVLVYQGVDLGNSLTNNAITAYDIYVTGPRTPTTDDELFGLEPEITSPQWDPNWYPVNEHIKDLIADLDYYPPPKPDYEMTEEEWNGDYDRWPESLVPSDETLPRFGAGQTNGTKIEPVDEDEADIWPRWFPLE